MSGNKGIDDAGALPEDAGLTAEELAAIAEMEKGSPMPTQNEGGDPPSGSGEQTQDGKPRPKQGAGTDADDLLEDGEEEITVDGKGRAHDQNGQFVSKSALLRVKEQNKKQRDELAAERDARAKLEGRLGVLTEVINSLPNPDGKGKVGADGKPADKPANPWDEQDIDATTDIIGALEQQRRRERFNYDAQKQAASGLQQRDAHTSMVQSYVADAKRLAADQISKGELVEVEGGQKMPAFQAAYMHLVAVRHLQLEALGMADKAARDQRIASEEADLVRQAIEAKRSPAETIFALAKASGFRMPAKTADNGKPNGQQQKTQAQLDAERRLEQVNRGMEQARSLSGKGGDAGKGITAAQIANMGDDEFAALVEKMGEQQFARQFLGAE